MKQNKITDGLDRTQYLLQSASLHDFEALENDCNVLFKRIMEMSRGIYYFNSSNQKDGYINELWHSEILPIFMEILSVDISQLEKEFIHNRGTAQQQEQAIQLQTYLTDWKQRLDQYCLSCPITNDDLSPQSLQAVAEQMREKFNHTLNLAEDKINLQENYNIQLQGKVTQQYDINYVFDNEIFYLFLMTIDQIQENIPYYLNLLEENSNLDPSLAIILAFLKNYQDIVSNFNRRWEALPSFYINEILKVKLKAARPDRTWLILKKNPGKGTISVKKGTGFIAGENPDGSRLCYRSVDDLHVSDARLCHLFSLYAEHDPERLPAGRIKDVDGFSYVTSIKHKQLDLLSLPEPQELFGDKGGQAQHAPVGMMVESPLLLLREGVREGTLRMFFTPASLDNFTRMLDQACMPGSTPESREQTIFKLLQDAFSVKISTTEGWNNIPAHLSFREGNVYLTLSFHMDESFPPTCACNEELHEMETSMPALQIWMNDDAWMFPFSWVLQTQIKKFVLHVKAHRITSLKIYGESGAVDPSAPFYPFGVQAKKNASMIFGNYEMSRKPLTQITLNCKWQQLPINETGFEGHYREYKKGIDNYSFRIRKEWLYNREWKKTETTSPLFTSTGPAAPVKDEASYKFDFKGKIPPVSGTEEAYNYGTVPSGFFRIVLDSPEIGFGDTLYRELFTQIMMQNSRLKKHLPLPEEPVSPMISELNITYEAEDEYIADTALMNQQIKLYYLRPLAQTYAFPVKPGKAIPLIQHTHSSANLLFGFSQAEGCERLRFFMDFTPRLENRLSFLEENLPEIYWYFFNGKHWKKIDSNHVHIDTTEHFTNSGLIELFLPEPVTNHTLDKQGYLWLWAAIRRNEDKCQPLRGIYMHPVQVIADGGDGTSLPVATITEPEKTLSGILSIEQIFPGSGGCPCEQEVERNTRIAHRIAHRNRLVTPIDFERMVMSEFPDVDKVKCFPGNSTYSPAAVTLVVMQQQASGILPVCPYPLLREIKERLQPLMSPMAQLIVINPVYEEVVLRCHILLHEQALETETLERLYRKINNYITPWIITGNLPVFGYQLSMEGMYTILVNDEGIRSITNLSLLYVVYNEKKEYELKEYPIDPGQPETICFSYPWSIPVPSKSHLITFLKEEDHPYQVGIGELTVGETFIIPKNYASDE